jgi:hypothetical protein
MAFLFFKYNAIVVPPINLNLNAQKDCKFEIPPFFAELKE